MMSAKERVAKMRARRKAAGICVECESPVVPGMSLCQKHREYYAELRNRPEQKAKTRAYYKRRILNRVVVNDEVPT